MKHAGVRVLAGVAAVVLSLAASAQSMSGFGAKRCSDYMSAVESGQKVAIDGYVSWVQGFIGGFNWTSQRREVPPIDPSSLTLWLIEYCGSNSGRFVFDAAQDLVETHAN